MTLRYKQLSISDGSWNAFQDEWRAQCQGYKEDFSDYAVGAFSVLDQLIQSPEKKAGVFAFCDNGNYKSVCQINIAGIPRYPKPVLRIRHLTLCPDLDYGERPVEDYAHALVQALAGILIISDTEETFKSNFVNFHLRSPADKHFFTALGQGLNERDEFASVQTVGAWLYITKSETQS